MLAAYSDACAVKGIKPAWRAAIRECGSFIIFILKEPPTKFILLQYYIILIIIIILSTQKLSMEVSHLSTS